MPTSRFSNLQIHGEPLWRHSNAIWPVSPALRPWLVDQGSLTQRLIDISGNRFTVQVIKQQWQLPRLSERLILGIRPRQLALAREVILLGGGKPWVYARSILPMRTLTGRLRRLRKLDNRPLGALLFHDHTMRRSGIEIACLTPTSSTLPTQAGTFSQPIWGRRSVFRLDNKPLLVSEIFLPGFPAYNSHPTNPAKA